MVMTDIVFMTRESLMIIKLRDEQFMILKINLQSITTFKFAYLACQLEEQTTQLE